MASSPLICVADYERFAEETIPQTIKDFVNGGAFHEESLADNVKAFKRYKLRPRYMVDVSEVSMTTTLLGQSVRYPLGVSPMTPCREVHPDGEAGLARACEAEGVCFSLSMMATTSIEDVAKAAPDSLRWMHVAMIRDRDPLRRVVARAERAEFRALILTVDSINFSRRYRNMRNNYAVPSHLKVRNLADEVKEMDSLGYYFSKMHDLKQTWKDIRWLKSITSLPIVVKGILTGHDARQALDHGADAIWVSNHGGRTLDSSPAPIDALGEVCQAVGGRAEVYLDGGVRSGLDVLKALSRGARAVFVGRPAMWGLANDVSVVQGMKGTQNVLNILREELKVGLELSGVTDVQHVPRDLVVHQSYYSTL